MEFPFPMSHRVCRRAPLSPKARRSQTSQPTKEDKNPHALNEN